MELCLGEQTLGPSRALVAGAEFSLMLACLCVGDMSRFLEGKEGLCEPTQLWIKQGFA